MTASERGDRKQCPSCKGDMYHYAGCGIGEHGERLADAPREATEAPPEAQEALREVPEAIWGLADMAEDFRWAARRENRGMGSSSGLAIQATDKAKADFELALREIHPRHIATALCVLRGLRVALRSRPPAHEPPKWFGHAAHLIVSQWCRFHLATQVGDYLVSTVGEYWPERRVREIHAEVHDPAWLVANAHRKGDDFDFAYMKQFGFEEIGAGRTYETMVFKAGKPCQDPSCGCELPEIDGSDLDFAGYSNPRDATQGHMAMIAKWSASRVGEPRATDG